jgi:hypothetical protein
MMHALKLSGIAVLAVAGAAAVNSAGDVAPPSGRSASRAADGNWSTYLGDAGRTH